MAFKRSHRDAESRARARFITQAIQLEEQAAPGAVRSGVLFSVLLLCGFLLWAASAELSEAARAPGQVIPAGLLQKVQHLEGGLVHSVDVRNGSRVKAGEVLLTLQPETLRSELEQLYSRRAAASLELERVSALLDDRAPVFESTAAHADLVARQRRLYSDQLDSHREQLGLLDRQVAQRETERDALTAELGIIGEELKLLAALSKMQNDMARTHLSPKSDSINARLRLVGTQREQRELQGKIRLAGTALEESRQRRSERLSRLREELSTQANELSASLAEISQAVIRAQLRMQRLKVRSPVDGIVTGLTVTTINEVVQPGEKLLDVVPTGRELMVEAKISPKDVGHVRVGQPVDILVSSYESTRFGSVRGRLHHISASTYIDDGGNPYYLAEVALSRDYVGTDPSQNRIIPGMTVQADVLTGKRTVMDYLLKPVYRGFQTTFKER